MSKELIAALAFGLSLVAAVFGFGMRIGTLTERIDIQTHQIDTMTTKLEALTGDFNGTRLEMLRLLGSHIEPATPARRPVR